MLVEGCCPCGVPVLILFRRLQICLGSSVVLSIMRRLDSPISARCFARLDETRQIPIKRLGPPRRFGHVRDIPKERPREGWQVVKPYVREHSRYALDECEAKGCESGKQYLSHLSAHQERDSCRGVS